jgi:hypothetical protein
MIWRGVDAYAADLDASAADLAGLLSRGELALFLGAGVSLDAKLPNWSELVKQCCVVAGIEHDDITPDIDSETLRARMDRVDTALSSKFRNVVHDAVYRNYTGVGEPTQLLRAIGALVMGSRRGSVRDVVTLNFDDVLESYLALHGFIADVIINPQRLRRSVDVNVFHPNGFLPYKRERDWSEKIIFTQESFNQTLGQETAFKAEVRQLLTTKVILAVGLSFRDPILTSLITVARDVIAPEGRPVAFWLTTNAAGADELGSMKKNNVVPLKFPGHGAYPAYLLKICQYAADRLREQYDS